MWLALLQGVSFATAPLLSFGPFKIYVLSSALEQGWRKSLHLALAPLIADIPVILLIWLILQQIPEWALNGLRLIGGVFYIYLAIGLVRNANRVIDSDAVLKAQRRTFWQAIAAIWVTPQVYINWSLIGMPALLEYAEASPLHAAAFLIGFYVLWVSGLAAQIVIMSQAGRLDQRVTRALMVVGALILIGFGVYQCWLGIQALFSA